MSMQKIELYFRVKKKLLDYVIYDMISI